LQSLLPHSGTRAAYSEPDRSYLSPVYTSLAAQAQPESICFVGSVPRTRPGERWSCIPYRDILPGTLHGTEDREALRERSTTYSYRDARRARPTRRPVFQSGPRTLTTSQDTRQGRLFCFSSIHGAPAARSDSAKHRQVQSASSRCIRREPPSRCDCRAIKERSLVVSSSAITQHRQLEVTNLVRCKGCPIAVVDRLQPRQGEAMTTTQCL
jgi:hypothetical protein